MTKEKLHIATEAFYLAAARAAGRKGELAKAEELYHLARKEREKALEEQYGKQYGYAA